MSKVKRESVVVVFKVVVRIEVVSGVRVESYRNTNALINNNTHLPHCHTPPSNPPASAPQEHSTAPSESRLFWFFYFK